jgi:hypothetical protein
MNLRKTAVLCDSETVTSPATTLRPRFGVATVKILLPTTGMAGYAAPWLSVAVTPGEPNGKSRFKE